MGGSGGTHIYVVKTKVNDGGSGAQDATKTTANSHGRVDAFAQLSNDDVRMRYLLGLDAAGDANNEDYADWQRLVGFQGLRRRREGADAPARKTRLSTELHSDAFMLQLLDHLHE